MVTKNAIGGSEPLEPAKGGTGKSSWTANTVLVGNGTGTPAEVAVGTNGQVLVGSTGSAPVFATVASADSSIVVTGGAGTIDLKSKFIQRVEASTTTMTTSTTTTPADDTIPQSSEGSELLNVAITPKNASNTLKITFHATIASSTNRQTCMLFQDAGANAIYTSVENEPTSGHFRIVSGMYTMAAGTTSSTTFRLKFGCETSGTITYNGTGGSRQYGGTLRAMLTVEEFA